ncbi:MAG: hypothetical protein HC836_50160 [Richelia sp. RM2_1_2]|nr:hypothetical protein [Richelia sp. SM1_7_0]NJN12470.1 hypothetical protein [Richelia sp. RM1_1_1]NJO29737.1 hypothetical protein [Richelia sp. SL_2_1]NJO65956.1 hypothetical protein [Richelia sp. RM2_1_2]
MPFLTSLLIISLVISVLCSSWFGIREFKFSRATAGTRITAFLITFLLSLSTLIYQQTRIINFSVTNNLTEGILEEQIILTVEGVEVGFISDINNPNSIKEFSLSKAGTYNYSVKLSGVYNNNGQEASFDGEGSGVIDVESKDIFEIQKEFKDTGLVLTVIERE